MRTHYVITYHTDMTYRSNLGSTPLKRRRRTQNPMRRYDALPAPLRHWLAQAALPWSPTSCAQIWHSTLRKGGTEQDALDRLTRAEQKTLAREAARASSSS